MGYLLFLIYNFILGLIKTMEKQKFFGLVIHNSDWTFIVGSIMQFN